MIWPFNFAERKARKLGRAKIMLAGYESKLKTIQHRISECETVPGVIVRDEQDYSEKIGRLKEEIRQLEVRP